MKLRRRGNQFAPLLVVKLRRVAVASEAPPADFAQLVASLRHAVEQSFWSPSLATRVDVVDDAVFGGHAVGTFGVEGRLPFRTGRLRMAESFYAKVQTLWDEASNSGTTSLARKDAINLIVHEYIHSVSSTHWDGTINEGLTELATIVFLDDIIRTTHLDILDGDLLTAVMPRGYVGAHVMVAAHLIEAIAEAQNRSPREVLRQTITLGGNLRALDLQIAAALPAGNPTDPRPQVHRLLAELKDGATATEGRQCGIAMAAELRRVAGSSKAVDPSPRLALDGFGVGDLEGLYGLN